ncbi:MAG: thiamine phosphate synthase [Bacteroidota bacterium]
MENKKIIERFQLITQNHSVHSHERIVEQACKGGIRWIQLRIKDKPFEMWKKQAAKTKEVCNFYRAKFIINDHVAIAREIGAYGVHLGKDDMHSDDARKILGDEAVIGATANTFEEILRHVNNGVDYIGLCPYRHTKTKLNLSPILGLDGYISIMDECKKHNINVPIIAIGGIQTEDIKDLLNIGIYGIAVSSAIINSEDIARKSAEFLDIVNKHI